MKTRAASKYSELGTYQSTSKSIHIYSPPEDIPFRINLIPNSFYFVSSGKKVKFHKPTASRTLSNEPVLTTAVTGFIIYIDRKWRIIYQTDLFSAFVWGSGQLSSFNLLTAFLWQIRPKTQRPPVPLDFFWKNDFKVRILCLQSWKFHSVPFWRTT